MYNSWLWVMPNTGSSLRGNATVQIFTAWNVSKYGVISGPYFPAFGLNTGKYGPEKTSYLDTFHAVLRRKFAESSIIDFWPGFKHASVQSDLTHLMPLVSFHTH